MFGFLLSQQGKMRQNASNWLEVAERVRRFRRDQLNDGQIQRLTAAAGDLRARLKDRADASRLKMSIEALEVVLRDVGGRMYPVSSLVENVEFFLVAAIVILGIRAYFVQPFKIPTNSMWPSYFGMTHELFEPKRDDPGILRSAGRFLAFGARHYSVKAPADGEVMIPAFVDSSQGLQPAYSVKSGRSFLIFPTMKKEYVFSVGGRMATVTVPADFDFAAVLDDALKGDQPSLGAALQSMFAANRSRIQRTPITSRDNPDRVETYAYWIPTGMHVKQGEPILSFDLLTGDLLFVDRFRYNFVRPQVGQGFVFKTGNIPMLSEREGDKYFIKRLVGTPGDTLEIRQPALFRNGEPITGAASFRKEAQREGLYPGYVNNGLLGTGEKLTVPEDKYFALGDNSPRSWDGRAWGFVPEKDVVGTPLFIYYPFTRRLGPAR